MNSDETPLLALEVWNGHRWKRIPRIFHSTEELNRYWMMNRHKFKRGAIVVDLRRPPEGQQMLDVET